MELLAGFLSLTAMAAAGYMIYVLKVLSARLGSVARMPPVYRLHWLGLVSVVAGMGGRLLIITGIISAADSLAVLLLYLIPLGIGVSASLASVWFYWRWLLKVGTWEGG
jgi:hypothetical protein